MRWRSGRRSGGIGVIVIALIAMYFGVDPSIFLNPQLPPSVGTSSYSVATSESPQDRQLAEFVSVVLADSEDTWHALFRQFDRADVLAHEIGHHVQTLLGISNKVHDLRGRVSEVETLYQENHG